MGHVSHDGLPRQINGRLQQHLAPVARAPVAGIAPHVRPSRRRKQRQHAPVLATADSGAVEFHAGLGGIKRQVRLPAVLGVPHFFVGIKVLLPGPMEYHHDRAYVPDARQVFPHVHFSQGDVPKRLAQVQPVHQRGFQGVGADVLLGEDLSAFFAQVFEESLQPRVLGHVGEVMIADLPTLHPGAFFDLLSGLGQIEFPFPFAVLQGGGEPQPQDQLFPLRLAFSALHFQFRQPRVRIEERVKMEQP